MGKHSSKVHTKQRKAASHGIPLAGKITLGIIISATIIILFAIIFSYFANPERVVKKNIERLATTYYEKNLYEAITDKENLSKYTETGLSRVQLRTLLINVADEKTANMIKKYCDENASIIQYFPEEPFSKNSYHTEYTYSCSF